MQHNEITITPSLRTLESYRKLFEIENCLRYLIVSYDKDYKRRVYNPSLSSLMCLVEKLVPRNVLPSDTVSKINWVIEIRNKVCHFNF